MDSRRIRNSTDEKDSREVNLTEWLQEKTEGKGEGLAGSTAHNEPKHLTIATRPLNMPLGTSDTPGGMRNKKTSVDDPGEVNLTKWLQENSEGKIADNNSAETSDSSSSVEGGDSEDDSDDTSDGDTGTGSGDDDSDTGDDSDDDSDGDTGTEDGSGDDDLFACPASALRDVVLGDKYRVVRELGKGTFGRVMECYEIDPTKALERLGLGHWRGAFSPKTSSLYAVKIIRNRERALRDAEEEADILRGINAGGGRGVALFPVIFEMFDLPTGSKCFVLEKLGMSLYDVIQKNDGVGFAIRYVREISMQLFDALDFLHNRGLIHTDIKPENILLVENNTNKGDARIKVIDFGSAVVSKYNEGTAKTSIVNTRQYRAPEILLRTGWSFPSDMWAAGCTIAELAKGYQLFPAKNSCEHLAMIQKRIGSRFPRRMILDGGRIATKCFDRVSAKHLMEKVLKNDSMDYLENECCQLKEELGEVAVASGLCDLLSSVLTIDPWFRPKAEEALSLAKCITCDNDISDHN